MQLFKLDDGAPEQYLLLRARDFDEAANLAFDNFKQRGITSFVHLTLLAEPESGRTGFIQETTETRLYRRRPYWKPKI